MSEFDERAKTWDDNPSRNEMARAVAKAVCARVPLDSSVRMLEYGCGTGLLSFALHDRVGHLTLADSSSGMLAVCAEKITAAGAANMEPLMLDLAAGPPPAAQYDVLCMQMVLHHVPDVDALLHAFHAMVRPGGWLCIADLDTEDGSFHGPDFKGHKGFDRAALAKQAEAAGFTPVSCDTCHVLRRESEGVPRDYPLFLLVCRR